MKPVAKMREEARQERRPEPRLDQVVARIREDARIEPRKYLKDAEVPGGGE